MTIREYNQRGSNKALEELKKAISNNNEEETKLVIKSFNECFATLDQSENDAESFFNMYEACGLGVS